MEKKRKSSGQGTLFGSYPRMEEPRVGDIPAQSVSGEVEELPGEGSGVKGEGRDFRNLGEDSLGEVFSHLFQKDLLEVMVVCKAWEKSVREGTVIRKEMDVYKKWDSNSGGLGPSRRGNETLFRVLKRAQDVSFSEVFGGDREVVMSVGLTLGPNLRCLKLPADSVSASFFPTLLPNCPHLKSLVVEGSVFDGDNGVHIHHPELETLELQISTPLLFDIDCPALTRLSTDGHLDFSGGFPTSGHKSPSLLCPNLTNLRLSSNHCARGALESIATLSPNVKCLEAYFTQESNFNSFTNFRGLCDLKIQGCGEKGPIPDNAFARWSHLESLQLDGSGFAEDLKLVHGGLRSLQIIDWEGCCSPSLACPSLEHMKVCGGTFDAICVENINAMCPALKRVEIGRPEIYDGYGFWDDAEKCEELLEFVHEGVEELVLTNLTRDTVCVDCNKLKKLVIKWVAHAQFASMTFPLIKCPNLISLELDGYTDMLLTIPQILAELPTLEVLRIGCASEESKYVVLKHERICDLVITESDSAIYKIRLRKLILAMPSLVRTNFERLDLQVIKTACEQ